MFIEKSFSLKWSYMQGQPCCCSLVFSNGYSGPLLYISILCGPTLPWCLFSDKEFCVSLQHSEHLHICIIDISPMWNSLLCIEFRPNWTTNLVTLKIMLGCSTKLKQKWYCKSDDPPLVYINLSYMCFSWGTDPNQHEQENPKLNILLHSPP